jgi:hypothetical protein
MARQTHHKAKKRQKELERMRKAKEKMDKRQGKIDQPAETETNVSPMSVTGGSDQ